MPALQSIILSVAFVTVAAPVDLLPVDVGRSIDNGACVLSGRAVVGRHGVAVLRVCWRRRVVLARSSEHARGRIPATELGEFLLVK